MAFNPPVPTPEVQTSQSSVLLGRRGWGILAPPLGAGLHGEGTNDRRGAAGFPVRPANTTLHQPV